MDFILEDKSNLKDALENKNKNKAKKLAEMAITTITMHKKPTARP